MKLPAKLSFLSKKRYFIPAIVIIMTLGFFLLNGGRGDENYETITITRETLIQKVLVSGKVNPKDKVSLSFEQTGKVAALYVKTGSRVLEGQSLAALSNSDLLASLDRAKASLSLSEATLAKVVRGSRPEEISIKEAELEKAEQDLENLYQGVSNVVSEGLDAADDAVSKRLDPLFNNDASTQAVLAFAVSNQSAKNSAEEARRKASITMQEFRDLASKINTSSSPADLEKTLASTKIYLEDVRNLLVRANEALNYSTDLSTTNLAAYKADVATARSSVTTAIGSTESQLNSILSQKVTVSRITDEVALSRAGSSKEEVDEAKARVEEVRADVRKAEAALAKTLIRSPFSGVVTNLDLSVGQIVSANTTVMSLISDGDFEIEINIPEVDIAKVKIGDVANVTLDAYSTGEIFSAKVVEIDPAEKVIEGVSTYEVILNFDQEDARIRSGMTANIEIVTAKKENIVTVPQRALFEKEGKKVVRVLTGEAIEERKVETGLSGDGAKIEIISGLSEGEVVITETKD